MEHSILRSPFLCNNYFFGWRIFATFYCFGGILWWGVLEFGSTYFNYLTHWSVILSSVYLLIVASLTTRFILSPHLKSKTLLYPIAESFQHISVPISIGVVIAFYFAYIEEPGVKQLYPLNALTIHDHGVSATLTFIDFMLSANVFEYWGTLWKPLFVSTCYTVFSLILGLVFDYNVYDQFEWKSKPKQSVLNVFLCYVVLWIVHMMLFLLKKAVATKQRTIMRQPLIPSVNMSIQDDYGSLQQLV